jgi:segregation and condensation protein B
MSLRAKIEAVVYAAEEPVTLAQLAGLFAEEALELKRERDAEAAMQEPAAAEQVPLPGETMEPPASNIETEAVPEGESGEGLPVSAGEDAPAPSPEAEEKRLARQKDREVKETLRGLLDELIQEYAQSDRGIEIREIAGGYRIGTKPEYHDSVRSFVKSLKPPMKLSIQALETLAVIAYKQPVTAPEVSEIRGVDSSGVLGSLISRKLITTAGRKQVIGRPILYKTTKEFLLRFGLKDVNELPSIEEFEKMAGELADTDMGAEPDSHVGTADELPFLEEGEAVSTEEGGPVEQSPGLAEPEPAETSASVETATTESESGAAEGGPKPQTVPAEED